MNRKNVKIINDTIIPSQGRNKVIEDLYDYRVNRNFTGDSVVGIALAGEPIWWNRPLEIKPMVMQEPDGLYSYNLPLVGDAFRSGYNLLFPKDAVLIAACINLEGWDPEEAKATKDFLDNLDYNVLIELGVPADRLVKSNNDLLIDEKKIAGKEPQLSTDIYTLGDVITTYYERNKDIFARLTGQFAHKRGITGVTDEFPEITPEMIKNKVYEKMLDFFN